MNAFLKVFLDFFPVLLFFLAYKFGDIYLATGVAIATSSAVVLFLRFKTGHFERMSLITLGTILVLGGATLLFRNELFIKWKPTALYWILALGFLLSHFVGKMPLMQKLLQDKIELPTKIWQRLNLSWVFFFTSLGALNIYVLYHFDTNVWVNFKLFGTLALSAIFVILQGLYMVKHGKPE